MENFEKDSASVDGGVVHLGLFPPLLLVSYLIQNSSPLGPSVQVFAAVPLSFCLLRVIGLMLVLFASLCFYNYCDVADVLSRNAP